MPSSGLLPRRAASRLAGELGADGLTAHAPSDFLRVGGIMQDPVFAQADAVILVTNAGDADSPDLEGWTILPVR